MKRAKEKTTNKSKMLKGIETSLKQVKDIQEGKAKAYTMSDLFNDNNTK